MSGVRGKQLLVVVLVPNQVHESLGVSRDAYHRYRRPCSQQVSFVIVD